MALISTVGIAKTGTRSLRATIPEGIVEFLDLKSGDKIGWEMRLNNGEKYVTVSKGFVRSKDGKIYRRGSVVVKL